MYWLAGMAKMCERFRADVSGCHSLQAVVANGSGSLQTLIDVGIVDDVSLIRQLPQTPARQSACSSRRTESGLALLGFCCCNCLTSPSMPSSFCT